jgi:hypothetical protein
MQYNDIYHSQSTPRDLMLVRKWRCVETLKLIVTHHTNRNGGNVFEETDCIGEGLKTFLK